MNADPKRGPPAEKPGRSDIDDSDQAADTRKPSRTGQADLSDKSGMLNEGGEAHRDDGAHNRAI